jgi:choline-sulfatase
MAKRPRRLVGCAIALAIVGLVGACGRDPGRQALLAPERVVLVTIDTLRADHVGAYGNPEADTPVLDALAAEGVRFEAAISPAPLTLPSHASLLTALDPPRHGVRDNATFRLPTEIPTLAERLREEGFATAAFLGAMVLDRQYGLARGFDVYDDTMGFQQKGHHHGIPERVAADVIDAALGWLEDAPDRFLLWIHLYDPHSPWLPPMWRLIPEERDRYAGEIRYADEQLGRLLEAMRLRWPGNRTLVVATADHGEGLGEHGEGTHSLGIYDSTQHIPLILAGAGLPRGRVVSALVRLVDIAPTLLALTGSTALPDTDGRDLLPLVFGEERGGRVAYVETLATQLGYGWSPLLGLRSERFKYIRAPRPELYDVRSDAGETRNLLPGREGEAAELDAELARRLARGRAVRPSIEPSDEERELLAGLGYVAGSEVGPATALGVVGGADPKDELETREAVRAAMRVFGEGRAVEALAKLEAIDEESFQLALFRAGAASVAGDATKTETYARRAIELEPRNADAHRFLGQALRAQGRLDEAERAFAASARFNPQMAQPYVELAEIAEERGDAARAVDWYARATEARGGSALAVWRLAALQIEAGRRDEADRLLARLAPADLATPDAAERLARAELAAGNGQRALDRLGDAIAVAEPEDRARLEGVRQELARKAAAGASRPGP